MRILAVRVLAPVLLCVPVWLCAPRSMAQAPDAAAPTDTESLKAAVDALQRQVPDQAHVMMDVDYHFSNLWFAAQKNNWPLAEFYLDETRSHLNWAVRIRPIRKLSSGGDLPLAPILLGVQTAGIAELRTAIGKRDLAAFTLAYRGMTTQCTACHIAAEKPYLRVHVPESPASRMIDFAPAP